MGRILNFLPVNYTGIGRILNFLPINYMGTGMILLYLVHTLHIAILIRDQLLR
jgi:hypothetical protein